MRNNKLLISLLRKIFVSAGIVLLVIALIVPFLWQWNIRTAETRAQDYVHTLRTLLPEPQGSVPEERRDNTMPVVSLDGVDFIGILEMPRYGSSLPVCGDWGQTFRYPCSFSGSIYNGSLQVGMTSQKGQYDFYREISVGDTIYFTDMEGSRFVFTVTDLCYEKHADPAALTSKESALTLFIKNIYAFEYILVFCNVLS